MIVFMTKMPESADVTKNVMIRTTHMIVIKDKNGPEIISPNVTNSLAVFEAPIIAPFASPVSSRSIAVPPRIVIYAKHTNAGAITHPMMNSRTVRPREMRARNNPTNGENAIHHAQ